MTATDATVGTGYEQVLVRREGAVAIVTLDRPERMNAWTPRLHAELHDALAKLDRDEATRAIVVTGAGRAFCAGADLTTGGFGTGEAGLRGETAKPWEMVTPVIAALNGHAVGVGITLPLQWDVRLVAEDAKLQFAFTQRGVVGELASIWILPRLVGVSRAAELLYGGDVFSGAQAAEWGVCSRALPAAEVLPAAIELASRWAERTSPAAVAVTKHLLWQGLRPGVGVEEALAWDDVWFPALASLPDAAEGVAAFLEKRQPVWRSTKGQASGAAGAAPGPGALPGPLAVGHQV